MSYSSIGSAIYSTLQGITDFNQVYNYEPKELLKYPCGTVTATSHSDTFSSTASNQRIFRFTIRLYFRTDTAQDAEGVLRDLADQVISTIEANTSLSGSCDFARPISGNWAYQEREVPVRVVEIVIECLKRLPR
jgi:hypothetical protein